MSPRGPSAESARPASDASIIALDRFIQATRDSGYKGTPSAVCELVDNSLQAGAKHVSIHIRSSGTEPHQEFEVSILDDGSGMDPFTLREALRFGGSSRFNDRRGMGRYGMGLPNASLSQARRVTVYSWQAPDAVYASHLDVDEIAAGEMTEVPVPRRTAFPGGACPTESGTLVTWERCDRLDNRRTSTIARKLAGSLGQVFRFFIWDGTELTINGDQVEAFDPLFVRRPGRGPRAEVFGEPLEYEIRSSPAEDSPLGRVRVTFAELPVQRWGRLSNDEKRDLGISKGAGVSVVRCGREVDYGWFFMGGKRRENYDDWFRCQIEFDPVHDEAFGITHTKQQARPQQHLLDALTPELEAIAHALNARVRKAHAAMAAADRFVAAEQLADRREAKLKPLPSRAMKADSSLSRSLKKKHGALRGAGDDRGGAMSYKLVEDDMRSSEFFAHSFVDGRLVVVINQSHSFYKKLYSPLSESQQSRDQDLRVQLEVILLAAARAAAAVSSKTADDVLARFRREWSDTLSTFLNG